MKDVVVVAVVVDVRVSSGFASCIVGETAVAKDGDFECASIFLEFSALFVFAWVWSF